ncbi:MAG: Flp pilus assembly complex ATPase component TadA [Gemmatimonadetes bacterium]|nr:Flp pilus assembly complex ATPase component TadA [Gemmatimonadota bacterium]
MAGVAAVPDSGREHWLARAICGGGLTDALVPVSAPPGTPTSEVWREIRCSADLDDAAMVQAVARFFRMRVADLDSSRLDALELLPRTIAERHLVFPIRMRDRSLVVATCNPSDVDAEREIGFASGRRAEFVVASPEAILSAIELFYEPDRAVEEIVERLGTMDGVTLEVLDEADEESGVEEVDPDSGPAVKLANLILHEAIVQGASDIHMQPAPKGGTVRFRVDGVLRTMVQLPLPVLSRVVSRVKVLGRMDIADRLRPQDGRAQIVDSGHKYDLRISTVPVRGAEKAVIRILDGAATMTLEETGHPERDLATLRQLLRQRDGILLVTGPTGSGKTTTIYGALTEIDSDAVNIMTVEDPVEYELPGLAQIQVEPKKGVTFASALKAILRQDPDVIFVGEIRDAETAAMAAQASLTGHLVLATVHANDAVGAIRRLTDLGLDIATVVQTLRGALAQRLVRRLCPSCVEPITGPLSDDEAELVEEFGVEPHRRAIGCPECHEQGYRGRLPIAEVLTMTTGLEHLILSGASAQQIERRALDEGMRCLREAALARVEAGETTLHEIRRVLGESIEGTGDGPDQAGEGAEPVGLTPPDAADGMDATRSNRVLVVDDDPVTTAVARALLERDQYEVDAATGGREALEKLAADDAGYALVVLDLRMPDTDGREVLQEIRERAATAHTPVIVLTSEDSAEAEAELLLGGADDYLRKPIDAVRFAARVQALLRRSAR